LNFNTKLPDESVNVTKGSVLLDLIWMFIGIFLFIITLYFSSGYLVQYAVKQISVTQEQKLFSFLNYKSSDANNSSTNERNLQALIDKNKKCIDSPYNFKIHISNSDDINAFALPGGYIIINKAILDNAKFENELVFVLAHEIGHFNNRDHLEGIGRSFVKMIINTFIGISDVDSLLESSLSFSESQFSQQQEHEADLYAVDFMQCMYSHTNGATDFFEHLDSDNNYLTLFSSHPEKLNRINHIKEYIKKKGYKLGEKKVLSFKSLPN